MRKTADAHWEYIEALTRATLATPGTSACGMSVDDLVELIGFHYKSAFIHGWKHGLEALRAESSAQQTHRSEAESCVSNLAASRAVVLDAGNLVVLDVSNSEEATKLENLLTTTFGDFK